MAGVDGVKAQRSVLLVVPYNPLVVPGGLQHRALRTAAALNRSGWNAAVAAPGPSGRCAGVAVVGFPSLLALARIAVQQRWRILHWLEVFPRAADTLAQHVVSGMLRACGIATVLGTGTPGNLSSRGLPRLLRFGGASAYSAAIVFNQEFAEEYAAHRFPRRRVHRVPQHVDCRRFVPPPAWLRSRCRRELAVQQDAFVVAYVGRLVQRKRVDLLIAACQRIADAPPNEHAQTPGWCLLIVGSSLEHEDSVDGDIAGLAGDLAKRWEVRRRAHVADPRPYYWAADVVVVPSDVDGEAAVCAEAAACGCPVIVSDAPSLLTFVPDDDPALVFPRGSVSGLAETLRNVRQLGGRRHVLADRQRDKVLERNDSRAVVPQLIGIYESLVQCRGAGAE